METQTKNEQMMFSVTAWVPTKAYQEISRQANKHTALYRSGVLAVEEDTESAMTKMTIHMRSVGRTQAMQTLVHLIVDSLTN